ncbi:MAG: hypothetical protein BSR46_15515 [Candidatus Dactylopiibacterium carminicum]|nr:MAG: hypothetical protein BSR46_15515 [Candidatus Dactylopiibacterium carminicum]
MLVDDDVLIDCGTGVGELPLQSLVRIDHVLLTHTHLDHVAMLPMLLDTVADLRQGPVRVYGLPESLEALRRHVFNWQMWPDFTVLPEADNPGLLLLPLQPGENLQLGTRRIRLVPALHTVPATGYCLDAGGEALVFTGDTVDNPALRRALEAISELRYLLIEAALPDSSLALAQSAGHLTPSGLFALLEALTVRPEVFVTHLKPGHVREITAQLASARLPQTLRSLARDQVFVLNTAS